MENIKKFTEEYKKILIISGSPRSVNSCPHMNSKVITIVNKILQESKYLAEFDFIDLSIGSYPNKPIIQPCKGCVSSGGGLMCNFPCNCYKKGSTKRPDLMHDLDIYQKLLDNDAFLIISPIHWFSLTSQVKAFFDRLVCVNSTITKDEAHQLFGKDIKKADVIGPIFANGEYNDLMRNHLEGKIGSFFVYGDNGADDYSDGNYPETFNPKKDDIKLDDIVKPFVYQCRYSGIDVPDKLVKSIYLNEGINYYDGNFKNTNILENEINKLVNEVIKYIDYEI